MRDIQRERHEVVPIRYDPDTYDAIVDTARLSVAPDADLFTLEGLGLEGVLKYQIGFSLRFTGEYVFNTTHLGNILRVHLPMDANAYAQTCKNNVLAVMFFRFPDDLRKKLIAEGKLIATNPKPKTPETA